MVIEIVGKLGSGKTHLLNEIVSSFEGKLPILYIGKDVPLLYNKPSINLSDPINEIYFSF